MQYSPSSVSLRKRKTAFLFRVLAGFLWVVLPCVSMAQRPGQDNLRSRVMERLDEEEASRLLSYFKGQRLAETFCFQFQLEHKPRRGRTIRYEGVMFGHSNKQGPVSRVKLSPNRIGKEASESLAPIELIVQNGFAPKVWVRQPDSEVFTLIKDGALFDPIFEGILYTPFDLQMPFIFWSNYAYEGPSRVLSRIGQKFLMFPPKGSLAEKNGVTAVRVSIDDTYYALLRAEVLQGDDEKARSQFTVRGIKKVQGLHIVKEVELKNLLTKDATTFKVKAAGLGFEFSDALFDPDEPAALPELSEMALEVF